MQKTVEQLRKALPCKLYGDAPLSKVWNRVHQAVHLVLKSMCLESYITLFNNTFTVCWYSMMVP